MARNYADAVTALNTLQSNFATVDAIRQSGKTLNQQAIPEMIEWCRRIGYEPHDFRRLNVIHIAGTKGKGSTSAFIASILSQYLEANCPASVRGKSPLQSIGLYTSPHLRFVRERIQLNNNPLSEEKFAYYFFETWDRLESSATLAGRDPGSKPAYFRFLTLMAFHVYMSEGVSTAVIECGIGGEYDSTNIITQPVVTGITSLAIDHISLLGVTIEQIAWHKAGIMKEGTRCFTVPQHLAAMTVLEDRARQKGVALEVVPVHPELQSDSVPLGLSASFQKSNASLAIAIAQHFLAKFGFPAISSTPLNAQFKSGLKDVRWGGRCETRHEPGITWCIDGGHTLESIELVGKWFAEQVCQQTSRQQERKQKRILIFNQQTRDANALARALHSTLTTTNGNSLFTHAIFCPNTTFKTTGFQPDLVAVNTNADDVRELAVQKSLARVWAELDPQTEVHVLSSIEEAVEVARAVARDGREDGQGDVSANSNADMDVESNEQVTVLVTGSLHLVGGLLEVLESIPSPKQK